MTLCQAYFDFGFPIFEPLPPHTVQWEASLTAVCPFQGGKVGRVEGVVSRAQGRRLHPHGSQVQGQVRPDPDAILHLRLREQKRDPQVLAKPDPREELRHRSAGGQEQFSRWSFNISSLTQVAILAQNKHHDSILTLLMKNHEVFRETRQLFFKIFM